VMKRGTAVATRRELITAVSGASKRSV
jgi:hypothetical protein